MLCFSHGRQQRTTWPVYHPSLVPTQWGGEENQKEKANLVGWDKNSLTEQQRKRKITTKIQIKRK